MAPAFPIAYTGQQESKNCSMKKSRSNYRHDVEPSPKRKCISLNAAAGDGRDRFGVPVEVVSVSGLSRLERERLAIRLKRELHEVRVLHKRIASFNSNANVLLFKQCETVLNRLMAHQFGWVFAKPVDVVKLNIPDYFNVIQYPMDLGTVKKKLIERVYSSPLDFAADVRLTFSNAMAYNPRGNDVHFMAQSMSKYFEQRWKVIEKKIPRNYDECNVGMAKKTVQVMVSPLAVKRVVSVEERGKMRLELEALLGELPEHIIDFLKENSCGDGSIDEDEIEIDIDALSDEVLLKLRKFLDEFVMEKKELSKAEPCEMELHNESGFSNSSLQPGKGNDAGGEEIDIGGSDHPVSSLPPLEIEKDTAKIDSSCRSPSSLSNSDSGSSSSDSDSGSPPGHASEGKTAQQQVSVAGITMDQNQSNIDQDVGKDQPPIILSRIEPDPWTKPLSVEVDSHREGESAPSERQVSPGKLYRAALLRNRFADTILKAQEKSLEKGEKRDPGKLRLEREELDRRRKEEKARLQAEAKAAEEARRKVEAEAAAAAKRKRELDREAARLALQKMEKTVDINENCRFLEDLEMLSAAPVDSLSSFMEDGSPNKTPNGHFGSFKFQGNSNPLEQLGLFMKDDDEEEEEVEAQQRTPDSPVDDVEEGEID